MRRVISTAAVMAAAGGMLLLAACSHVQPSLGQYAITTGHGNLSSQQVQSVTGPGQDVQLGSGTTTWYIPADVRNYVTYPTNADRTVSATMNTGPGSKGEPGMPVTVQSYLGFEVNPAIQSQGHNWSLATIFLGYCLKYACASQTPQNDTSNADLLRSSSPGWEAMLNELMPTAIDQATQKALAAFPPSLWTDKSQYPAVGDLVAKFLPAELQQLDGSAGGMPFFCGPDSTFTKCQPFTFLVKNVVPANPGVIQAYNSQVQASYAAQAASQRVAAARALYGPYAQWELAMQDLENNCQQGTTCQFILGYQPGTPLK